MAGNGTGGGSSPQLTSGSVLIKEVEAPKTSLANQDGWEIKLQRTKTIPLLPVRYAIAPKGGNIPWAETPFKITDCDKNGNDKGSTIDLGKETHYTTRRLRRGFLYVYGEKDKGWRIFEIRDACPPLKLIGTHNIPMDKPIALRYPSDAAKYQSLPSSDKNFDLLQQPTNDGMLRVPQGKQAIWLGFSDVWWTDDIIKKHEDPSIRKKTMRSFDPDAWSGKPKSHTAPLADASKRVAEFHSAAKQEAFSFSKAMFTKQISRNGFGLDVKKEDLKKAAILAIEDPAGIAMDLAGLMVKRYEDWTREDDPDYTAPAKEEKTGDSRPDATRRNSGYPAANLGDSGNTGQSGSGYPAANSSTKTETKETGEAKGEPEKPITAWTMLSACGIEKLKVFAENRAVAKAYDDNRADFNLQSRMDMETFIAFIDDGPEWAAFQKRFNSRMSRLPAIMVGDPENAIFNTRCPDQLKTKVKTAVKKARDGSWNDFKVYGGNKIYDDEIYNNWKTAFKKRFIQFDQDSIVPLAKAHVKWCESGRLRAYFNTLFDYNDAGAGVAFTATLTSCYEGVQDKTYCYDHILHWLEKPISDENLIVKGLVFNHAKTLKAIEGAEGQHIAPKTWLSWIAGLAEITEPLNKAAETTERARESAEATEAAARKLHSDHATASAGADTAMGRFMAEVSNPLQESILINAKTGILKPSHAAAAVSNKHAILLTKVMKDPSEQLLFYVSGKNQPVTQNMKQTLMDVSGWNHKEAGPLLSKVMSEIPEGSAEGYHAMLANPKLLQQLAEDPKFDTSFGTLGKVQEASAQQAIYSVPGKFVQTSEGGVFVPEGYTAEAAAASEAAAGKVASHHFEPAGGMSIGYSILAIVISAVAYQAFSGELLEAKGFEKEDLIARKHAMSMVGIGAFVEGTAKVLERIPTLQEGALMIGNGVVKFGGALAGVIGGAWLARREWLKAREAAIEGEPALAAAYYISTGFLFGMALASFVALLPWFLGLIGLTALAETIGECAAMAVIPGIGWLLAFASILVALAIANLKIPARMRDWLKQCCWGMGERFGVLEQESKELQVALAG